MPKVAMLAHTYYLRDPRVRREAEALAEKGFEVHVICLWEGRNRDREPRHAIVNGVQIHRLPISRRRGGCRADVDRNLPTGALLALWTAGVATHRQPQPLPEP